MAYFKKVIKESKSEAYPIKRYYKKITEVPITINLLKQILKNGENASIINEHT